MKQEDFQITEFIESVRFYAKNYVAEPTPIVMQGECKVATAGGLTVIAGPSKAGKTFLSSAFLTGCLNEESNNTLGFSFTPNEDDEAIIYINTELSPTSFQKRNMTILKTNNLEESPSFFYALNFASINHSKLLPVTLATINAIAKKHGGVRLIIIDGVADYTSSVNDEAQSNNLIEDLQKITRHHAAALIVIIHYNPSNGDWNKARGHLGSQLERKCESFIEINVKKNTGERIVSCKYNRDSKEFQPFLFTIEEGKPKFLSFLNDIKANAQKEEENALASDLKNLFQDTEMDSDAILSAISTIKKVEKRQSQTYRRRLIASGLVLQTENKKFRILTPGK
jgi:archaellum biogenesis ATPase FlaH